MSIQPGPVLAALFGADHAGDFLSHWPERHYAVHRPPGALPPALHVPELASLEALARAYRGPVTFGRGTRDARTINVEAHALHLFQLGLTVYLPDIARFVPALAHWLQALEQELGLPAACSTLGAFASPPGDGVSCHFDADDVISIQLQGRKVFHVAKVDGLPYPSGQQFGPGMLPGYALYPQAGAGFPSPDSATFESIAMEPGSVLFLPRGTWHRSVAEQDSFSVSIGIRPPTAMEQLLKRLHDLLLQQAEWRRPLYEANQPAGRDTLATHLDGLLAQLPKVLAQIQGADLLQPEQPPLPLKPASRLQRVPMASLTYQPLPQRLKLSVSALDQHWVARTTLDTEVPAHLAEALAWLAGSQAAFSAGDFYQRFASLAQADKQQLLELLARCGYLRLLWYPLLVT
ncbi:MAG: hypothetical protein RLZZ237_3327 [Pseudomonadota bacterium]